MYLAGIDEDIQAAIEQLPSALPTSGEKVSPLKPIGGGDVQKSQSVRLLDVLVLGPAMVYTAMDVKPPKLLRAFMMAVGIGTVLYNLGNYLEQEKHAKQGKA